jgi:hypothetical protein
MYVPSKTQNEFETSQENFSQEFSFDVEGGFTKAVHVHREGNVFTVTTRYADLTLFEETREVFEADGPVNIATTDSGVYITSCRSMLSDRVRLRRTRFF